MVLKGITRYKEDTPRAEDKPKRELSVGEWMQSMADAGFDGKFIAVANDGRQYKGELTREGDKVVVKSRKIPTEAELKAKMQQLKKN